MNAAIRAYGDDLMILAYYLVDEDPERAYEMVELCFKNLDRKGQLSGYKSPLFFGFLCAELRSICDRYQFLKIVN